MNGGGFKDFKDIRDPKENRFQFPAFRFQFSVFRL